MTTEQQISIEEYFPVGQRVRCENECFPGKWENGTVAVHQMNSFGECQWMSVRLDPDECGSAIVEYDYRYLDCEDSRNSLVRKVK